MAAVGQRVQHLLPPNVFTASSGPRQEPEEGPGLLPRLSAAGACRKLLHIISTHFRYHVPGLGKGRAVVQSRAHFLHS